MSQRLRFLDHELEPDRGQVLRRDSTPLDLTPRQLQALQLLVERAGQLVDKETLFAALWPGLVVEENNLSQLVAALRRQLGDSARDSRYIQTVPRRGFRFVAPVERVGAAEAAPLRLAVLPVQPLLSEGRDPLLELGMADSLIARLSLLPWLAVLSLGSVRRHAAGNADPLLAGRALGADLVVEGTLQRADGDWQLRARLLRVADGTALWSAGFRAATEDLFELQDRIGEQLAQALAPVLREQAAGAPALAWSGGTHSVEAYRRYLQGLGHMLLQRGDELHAAIAALRAAVAADPGFARAWVGLADALRRVAFVGEVPPRQTVDEATHAAQRALALDPSLGEAHVTRGYQQMAFEHDWDGAEQSIRHGLALNPSLPLGHFALGQLLLVLRGAPEGLAHLRRAVELDPLQPLYGALEASFLRNAGRRDEARARLARVLQMAPAMPLAHLVQAQTRFDDGDAAAGLASLRQAVALAGGASVFDGLLGFYLARLGRSDEARAILAQLQARSRISHVAGTSIAAVHAGLGEPAQALDALERALHERDLRIGFIKDAPYWEGLRAEPRFAALLRQLRLDGRGPGIWNP